MTEDHQRDQPPTIDVEGCLNFRDAGGWPLQSGQRMRTDRLYRSDGPARVTDVGRRTVESMGVVLAVDLRQHAQFAHSPGFLPPERTAHVSLVDRLIDNDAPPPLERPADFADLYDAMLVASREPLARAVDLIADALGRGPVLVHCSFGKDRAGLISAVIQAAIGVDTCSIVEDYGRSDEPSRRRMEWMEREPWPGDLDLATVPREIFRAHAEAMSILLERLSDRHGSLALWLETFPFEEGTLERLREALIEERPNALGEKAA